MKCGSSTDISITVVTGLPGLSGKMMPSRMPMKYTRSILYFQPVFH